MSQGTVVPTRDPSGGFGPSTRALTESGSRLYELAPVLVLFFISGIPALIYQLVWQRSLFAIYGTNIESVVLVVSAFMLGLGIGSLLGGYLSRQNISHLAAFALVELGTGVFGLCSLKLFHTVAVLTTAASTARAGAIAFALLLIPTMLMGSTLPLLVRHMVARMPNVGRSLGLLYFVNTLGSACGCLLTAKLLMPQLGQAKSVLAAAGLNAVVAGGGILLFLAERSRHPQGEPELAPGTNPGLLPLRSAALIAGASGFVALGYEIIWYRFFSFCTGTRPKMLAIMLAAYLTGLAYGSMMAEIACKKVVGSDASGLLRRISVALIAGNLLGFVLGPLLGMALVAVEFRTALTGCLIILGISTAFLGMILPLVAHLSIGPDANAGGNLSYIYLSNIVGCTLGSLVVGFVLMDHFSMPQVAGGLAVAGVMLAIVIASATGVQRTRIVAIALVGVAFIAISAGPLYHGLYERLLYKKDYSAAQPFVALIENRSGVIAVSPDTTVWGGGAYDGKFNTSLVHDTNGIFRPFALSFFHPNPQDVLVIGLSAGSWTKVLLEHPQVRHVTAIEINPGYLGLIKNRREVSSVLSDSKTEIIVADGRRWLVRHPERKYDAIVMNTTLHWRAHATNLLSVEFINILRSHLKPGGVAFYNTTYSDEALLTGVTVFPYGLRVANFVAVSATPLNLDKDRWTRTLLAYRIDGSPVLDASDSEARQKLESLLAEAGQLNSDNDNRIFEPAELVRQRLRGKRIVTDDNMATEWHEE